MGFRQHPLQVQLFTRTTENSGSIAITNLL